MNQSVSPIDDYPIWIPDKDRIAKSHLTAFINRVGIDYGVKFFNYSELHHWSIEHPEIFWRAVWDYCQVLGEPGDVVVENSSLMPGAIWFPQARLNFAENLLRNRSVSPALIFSAEGKLSRKISFDDLYRTVAQLSQALTSAGIEAGDRIVAYLPNLPETIMVMLAAASIGAVFSSCSPDFGVQGVVDRFGQIKPKILFAADGYYYNEKKFDSLGKLSEILAQITSLEQVIIIPYVNSEPDLTALPKSQVWENFIASFDRNSIIKFVDLPFGHPLYVMYSSGTTGAPKCIIHSTGGTLLQHLKEHQLHTDIRAGDRLFYFTTCGWMMWNWLASGLASEAGLLLYDGSPFVQQGRVLFDFLDREGVTQLGTSAKFIDALSKSDFRPHPEYRLENLRTILSTGSPLAPEGFDFVYRHLKPEVHLASISGGTDIISCFVLGNPTLPVYRGEIQCKGLGMAVDVFDDTGNSICQAKGELVCTQPFPSMPIGFGNDPDGAKYRDAYFSRFPNVWAHGDYAEITRHDGMIIYGRSDATLNPGGVRIGTAEIYRQVEQLPEVWESVVVGQEWEGDVRIVLFVRLRDAIELDEILIEKIKRKIREHTTPRHVPAKIISVPDIPRTKSGKITELAVREVLHGRPVKNQEALANPEALKYFRDSAEL